MRARLLVAIAIVAGLIVALADPASAIAMSSRPGAIRVTITAPDGVAANVVLHGLGRKADRAVVTKPSTGTVQVLTVDEPADLYEVSAPAVVTDGVLYTPKSLRRVIVVAPGFTTKLSVTFTKSTGAQQLHVTSLTQTSVALAWTAAAHGHYVVRRAVGSVAPASRTQGVAVPVSGLTARDSSLQVGTKYAYSLFTSCGGSWSGAPLTITLQTAPAAGSTAAAYVAEPTTLLATPSQIASESPTGSGVQLTLAAGTTAPVIGAAVVLPVSTTLVGGFLGVVQSVSADGRTVVLTAGGLADAFDYYRLATGDFTTDASLFSLAQVGAAQQSAGTTKRTAATSSPSVGTTKRLAAAAPEPESPIDCKVKGPKDSITFTPKIALGGHFNTTLNKYSVLGVSVPDGATIDTELAIKATGTISVKTEVSETCDLDLGEVYQQLSEEPVPIGVKVEPHAEMTVKGSLEADGLGATVEAGVQINGTIDVSKGASFKASRITDATPLTPAVKTSGGIEISLGSAITLGAGEGTTKVGAIAGVTGTFDPLDGDFTTTITSTTANPAAVCTEIDLAATFKMSLTASMWFPHYTFDKDIPIGGLDAKAEYPGSPWSFPDGCADEAESSPVKVGTQLPDATVGAAYSASLTASGGLPTYKWSVITASLPPGISIDSAGHVTGTPTTSGTYSFAATATDSVGDSAAADVTLRVDTIADPVDPVAADPGAGAPADCFSGCAVTWGDPHLTTFDGATLDAQLVGELIAVKSTTDDLQVQVRQQPYFGSRQVAGNVATALEVSGHRVVVSATSTGVATKLDGSTYTVPAAATALPGGGTIQLDTGAQRETVVWPDGSFVAIDYGDGENLNLSIGMAAARAGHLSGLLGNDDGDPTNDLTSRTGTVIPYPASSADTVRTQFSATWRVKQAESLFDYASGQSTATFTDVNFPYSDLTVDDLPQANRDAATATCTATGVTDPTLLAACTLDVAVSGKASLATGALTAQQSTTSNASPKVIAASAAGQPWTDDGGAKGTSALTFGHQGCGGLDANDQCTDGSWVVIPGAPWIWTSQFTTAGQYNVTFTATVTLTAAQAAKPLTLTAAADDSVDASVNGTSVLTAGYNAATTAQVTLKPGVNTLTFFVQNNPGDDPQGNPAGLAWKLEAN